MTATTARRSLDELNKLIKEAEDRNGQLETPEGEIDIPALLRERLPLLYKVTSRQIYEAYGREAGFEGDWEFVRDEGGEGYALYMSGHYTADELEWAMRECKQANRYFSKP